MRKPWPLLAKRVGQEHGRCDILVNNAGVAVLRKPLVDLPVKSGTR